MCYRFRYGFVVIVCFSTIVILTVVRFLFVCLFVIFSEESFEYWDCFIVELPGELVSLYVSIWWQLEIEIE